MAPHPPTMWGHGHETTPCRRPAREAGTPGALRPRAVLWAVTFQRTRAQGPAAEQRHALTRGVGVALDGAWRPGMVRPPVVPLLAWWATGLASASCPDANRQQHLRRSAGGVQGPPHRPRVGRTHERGVLPFHGRPPVARSPYSYENSFLTQESYGYAVVSRKILAQTRSPPALPPKARFPYELSAPPMARADGDVGHEIKKEFQGV
jgi:hypothetical protein